MASKEPTTERNLDGYGAPAIAWNRVRNQLDKGFTQAPGSGGPNRHTVWLSTVNPDGSPHVMPLGALWIGGDFYFTSGPGTRKSQNLARNPHCVLSVATEPFDLVIEGDAVPPGTYTNSRPPRSMPWERPSPTARPAFASKF